MVSTGNKFPVDTIFLFFVHVRRTIHRSTPSMQSVFENVYIERGKINVERMRCIGIRQEVFGAQMFSANDTCSFRKRLHVMFALPIVFTSLQVRSPLPACHSLSGDSSNDATAVSKLFTDFQNNAATEVLLRYGTINARTTPSNSAITRARSFRQMHKMPFYSILHRFCLNLILNRYFAYFD